MPDEIANAIDKSEPAIWLGRQYARFRRLTSHPLFDQIYGQMLAGVSPARIAVWIQQRVTPDDVFGPDNIAVESLERSLYRFRSMLPDGVFLARNALDERFKRVSVGIDAIEEFDTLIRLQKARISTFMHVEKSLPLAQMRLEIETLAMLLEKRNNAANGTVGPAVTVNYSDQHLTLNAPAKQSLSATVQQFVANNPDTIVAVVEALERMAKAEEDIEGIMDGRLLVMPYQTLADSPQVVEVDRDDQLVH